MSAHWEAFEDFSIVEHARLQPTHVACGWKNVPEEWLWRSGFIHAFNEVRMARLLRAHEHKQQCKVSRFNPLQDTGFDGMACDNEGVFHGLQAKCYSKAVAASDIGSALAKSMLLRVKMPQSKLFLYTLSGVTRDLDEVIVGTKQVVHTQLKLAPIESAETEQSLALRPHQQEALNDLLVALESESESDEEDEEEEDEEEEDDDEDSKDSAGSSSKNKLLLLHMPCGTGKTLVAAHVLCRITAARIVVAAPLKTLVEQLRSRIMPFLPDYTSLVVDSDGTTDTERVRLFLAANERSVLFTTFDSAVGVLSLIEAKDNEFLILDEAHNAHGNADLTRWAQTFERGLVLTATPQNDLDEKLGCEMGYALSFRAAIDQHLLCDYAVWFPLITDMSPERPLEIEIADLPRDAALKALFLIRGMLHTGARRTFAYLGSQEEARKFAAVFAQVADKHHGVPTWTGVIVSDTTHAERAALLSSFRSAEEDGVLCVLASVRILDEGIDEPLCDSTFFGSLSDTASELRVVQRLMRGSRLDPARPHKKNHAFVWADANACSQALQLLKEADPTFSSRVRVLSSSYDTQTSRETMDVIAAQQAAIQHFINVDVRCVSAEDLWNRKFLHWRTWVTENGRLPNKRSENPDEKRAGQWQSHMRELRDKPKDPRYAALSAEPLWQWGEKAARPACTFDENLAHWSTWVAANGRLPRMKGKDIDEKRAGTWQNDMRKYFRDKPGDSRHFKLSAEPLWEWGKKAARTACTFDENLAHWSTWVTTNSRLPRMRGKDPDEKRAGQWQNDMRKLRDKPKDPRYAVLSAEPLWQWGEKRQEKSVAGVKRGRDE